MTHETRKEMATMVLDRFTRAQENMTETFSCEFDRGFFAGDTGALRDLLAELLDCKRTGTADDFAERLRNF